ncbi:Alpha/Beta hydrolase protein [Thelonectria olida]|uniref:Alpha/Beta hydrolase protein n=1 Tax=Thelonectria olida TaxID=1576542 RepID=A0A9P8VWF7_9HYPO|nr:Alpha/Beta hydrolase protein [Thelonectria olida]
MPSQDQEQARHLDESIGLKFVRFAISSPAALRSLFGVSAATSAAVGDASRSLASSDNSAATSKAVKELSEHINIILEGDRPQIGELSVSKYLGKVDDLRESRLSEPEEGFKNFQAPAETWHLIATAVKHSAASYKKSAPADYQGVFIKPRTVFHHIKATRIEVVEESGEHVIIVSIRGSATLDDWLLNFNGDHIAANIEETLDQTRRWHRGFLESFKSGEAGIAEGIQQIVTKNPQARHLLFTGHSAGGAIAQLCYNACGSADSSIGRAASGLVRIDCITFGAPPVAKTPIMPRPAPSVFLSIMNEGDPVVLAQREFIKSLFGVYLLSKTEWDEKYPQGFEMPQAELHVSGTCVVMRDTNEDEEDEILQVIEAKNELVEGTLFGNFLLHLMRVYTHRVETLVTAALETPARRILRSRALWIRLVD